MSKQTEQKQDQKNFNEKYKSFKEEFIANNSIESMVFENGSAIAMAYRELEKLNAHIIQIKNILQNDKES